jgi:hypothetical protein
MISENMIGRCGIYSTRQMTQVELAKKYSVTQAMISSIVRLENWKQVT